MEKDITKDVDQGVKDVMGAGDMGGADVLGAKGDNGEVGTDSKVADTKGANRKDSLKEKFGVLNEEVKEKIHGKSTSDKDLEEKTPNKNGGVCDKKKSTEDKGKDYSTNKSGGDGKEGVPGKKNDLKRDRDEFEGDNVSENGSTAYESGVSQLSEDDEDSKHMENKGKNKVEKGVGASKPVVADEAFVPGVKKDDTRNHREVSDKDEVPKKVNEAMSSKVNDNVVDDEKSSEKKKDGSKETKDGCKDNKKTDSENPSTNLKEGMASTVPISQGKSTDLNKGEPLGYSGTLYKSGNIWRRWKKRSFTLEESGILSYRKDEGSSDVCGSISLKDYGSVVDKNGTSKNKGSDVFEFYLKKNMSSSRMKLAAGSQREKEKWIEMLQKVIEKLS